MQVFPPSPIHLSLAGINLTRCTRCGVARGGRASGLESCPLDSPVPPMLARPPVYTHIHISIHALCCIKSSIHLKLIGFYIIHVAVCDRRLLIHRDHKHVKGKLLWQKTEKHFFSLCYSSDATDLQQHILCEGFIYRLSPGQSLTVLSDHRNLSVRSSTPGHKDKHSRVSKDSLSKCIHS